MSTFLFANNAITTLASSAGPGATLIQVSTGSGDEFPSPAADEQFAVTLTDAATGLIDEIVYCTARSGDDLTVVRAQEGTTALSWGVGDGVANLWTAGQAAALVQLPVVQKQATNFGGTVGGSANALTAALSPPFSAYATVSGSPIRLRKGAGANTGAVTLNVNAIAPKPVVYPGGAALAAGALGVGAVFEVIYDSDLDSFILMSNPTVGSPSGAVGGDLIGTLPNPTIGANKVTVGKMQQVAGLSLLANLTGGLANLAVVTVAALIGAMGIDVTHVAFPAGYMDIVGVRFQWDVVTNNDDTYNGHVMPAAFLDANFIAFTGIKFNNSPPKTGGNGGGATWYPINSTTIGILTAWNGDSTGINQISYLAIGRVP